MRRVTIIPLLGAWVLACGGTVEQQASGAASGSSASAGAGGVPAASSTTASAIGGAGGGLMWSWTDCTTPDGFAVCDGPNHCPETGPFCQVCFPDPTAIVNICVNDAWGHLEDAPCWACSDSNLCIQFDPVDGQVFSCAPLNLAQLYHQSGADDYVRYADHSLYDGTPLPEPDTCPTLANVPLCGGHCGGCPSGQTCTGRSPTHPYGLCVISDIDKGFCDINNPCPDASEDCFFFTVEPEAQPDADLNGYCFSPTVCAATAANLPGGGTCKGP